MTVKPEPAPVATQTTPAPTALDLLRAEGARFLIVEEDGRPQAVLTADELEAAGTRPVSALAGTAFVVADAPLDASSLADIALTLLHTRAQAVVVLEDEHVVGVLGSDAVAEALPLDDALLDQSRQRGLPGDAAVESRLYVCRKCSPPTYRRPRGGFEAPVCPRDSAHGLTERDKG
jgi:hypothetical protein